MSLSRQGSSHENDDDVAGGIGEIYNSQTPLAAQFPRDSAQGEVQHTNHLEDRYPRQQQQEEYQYRQHQQQDQQQYASQYSQEQQASYPSYASSTTPGFYRGRSTSSYPSAMPLYSSFTNNPGYYPQSSALQQQQQPTPPSTSAGPSTTHDAHLQYLPIPQQPMMTGSFPCSSSLATGVPLFATSATPAYPSTNPYYQQQAQQAYGAAEEGVTLASAGRMPAGLPAGEAGPALASVMQRSYSDEEVSSQQGFGTGTISGTRTPTAGDNFASNSRASSGHSQDRTSRPSASVSAGRPATSASTHRKPTTSPDEHVRSGGKTYDELYAEGEDDDYNPEGNNSGDLGGREEGEDKNMERDDAEGGKKKGKAGKGKAGKAGAKGAAAGGSKLSHTEKLARNRESSQRFRNKAKERSTAIRERMKWLEDRVKSLEQELLEARSGIVPATTEGAATAVQLYDSTKQSGENKSGSGQSAESTILMLRRENERLTRSLRATEDELLDKIEQLRLSPPSPPHSWPYPHGTSSSGPIRRHSSTVNSHSRQRTSHSRISSYGSSTGSGYGSNISHAFTGGDPSSVPSSISNLSHAAQVFNRARSSSLASSVTTASSSQAGIGQAHGSPRSFQYNSCQGGGVQKVSVVGAPLSRSASLNSSFYRPGGALPTVPGSATLPSTSFAEYQDEGSTSGTVISTGPLSAGPGPGGSGRARGYGSGMFYNTVTTPTIASAWQTTPHDYQPQSYYSSQYPSTNQQYQAHTRAATDNSPLTGQFATYPNALASSSSWQPIPTPAPTGFVDPAVGNSLSAMVSENRPASTGTLTPFVGGEVQQEGQEKMGQMDLKADQSGLLEQSEQDQNMDIAVTSSGVDAEETVITSA